MDLTGSSGLSRVSLGSRFASAWVDLTILPIFLGLILGFVLSPLPQGVRSLFLILINWAWLCFRDVQFSPGRKYNSRLAINVIGVISGVLGLIGGVVVALKSQAAGVGLISMGIIFIAITSLVIYFDKKEDMKLISLNGDKVTLLQAVIRNILLIIPFVLVIGYIVEIVALIAKGERVADGWAKTRVVSA